MKDNTEEDLRDVRTKEAEEKLWRRIRDDGTKTTTN